LVAPTVPAGTTPSIFSHAAGSMLLRSQVIEALTRTSVPGFLLYTNPPVPQ
jgi:hypothetical protein